MPRAPFQPTQCPVIWLRGALSPEGKWSWREANHPRPSSVEVKNEWN
jgi:hypothetical protein